MISIITGLYLHSLCHNNVSATAMCHSMSHHCHIENDRHKLGKLGIQLWKRHVDDVFAIVKNNEANNILQYLNRKHDSIKFIMCIMCMAEQSKLQFLDMVVMMIVMRNKTKQHYCTNIYHKPTDTGLLYSLYDSYVPAEYKLETLNALLHRAWKICTNI